MKYFLGHTCKLFYGDYTPHYHAFLVKTEGLRIPYLFGFVGDGVSHSPGWPQRLSEAEAALNSWSYLSLPSARVLHPPNNHLDETVKIFIKLTRVLVYLILHVPDDLWP